MEALTIKELYTLEETIAKDIFDGATYPWEVLPKISAFIMELGNTLSSDEYEKRGENVWVAKSAKVSSHGIHQRSCHHRKRGGSTSLRIHPRQCHCRRGRCRRKFYGA